MAKFIVPDWGIKSTMAMEEDGAAMPYCHTEVEFLEEIQTEVLRVFLLAIHRHLYILADCTPHLLFFGLEISTSNSWVKKYIDQ